MRDLRLPPTPVIYGIWRIDETGEYRGVYPGSSACGKDRQNTHLRLLRKGTHHCCYLQRAWNKYGEEQFIFEVLEEVSSPTELVIREQFWIDSLVEEFGRKFIFNTCLIAGRVTGHRHSPETRAKMSASLKGRKKSAESVERSAAAHRGRKRSQDTCDRIKASHIERWTIEARARASAIKTGIRPSAETRTKMSESQKRRYESDEERSKIVARQTGTRRSVETRAKMSASLIGKLKTATHCANMAAAATRRFGSQEEREKASISAIKRCESAEYRAKLSAAQPVGVSGIKGVKKHGTRWVAQAPGHIYLGIFDTIEDAVAALRDHSLL